MSLLYSPPVKAPVSQGFGANSVWYKRMVGQMGHNGIDYACPVGTPIHAIADGIIAFEGWGQYHRLMGKAAGICVIIRHAKHHSGYAHLSRTLIDNGQRVRKGQIIGYSGMSGLATGPHLHFEIMPLSINTRNGYYGRINPAPVMALKAPAAKLYYTVKKGDNLSTIAAKLKVSLKTIVKLNPQIKNINVISIGQKVRYR